MSLLSAYLLRGKLKTERPSEWDMILPRPPRWGQAEQRCGEIPGQAQKNDIRRKRQRESRVHRNNEHRIVAPTIRIRSLAACGSLRGSTPEYPY